MGKVLIGEPWTCKVFYPDKNTEEAPTSIETLEVSEVPEQAPISDCWDKAAKRMM